MFFRRFLSILALVLLCTSALFSPLAKAEYPWVGVNILEHKALEGDYLLVDLQNSFGYLINESSKTYASFPLLSGRKRFVHYLGRSYFAATPEQTWYIKDKTISPDRVTFAQSGEFFALYKDEGQKRTSYGLHGHRYFDIMMARENKYVSYGCVIVADDVLDVLEHSFEANGRSMKVVTTSDEKMFEFLN